MPDQKDPEFPLQGDSVTAEGTQKLSSLEMRASLSWSAPLPPPAVLKQYNSVFPGCAERIVALAESQAAHRQAMETNVIKANIASQRTGLWLGFFLALIVILLGSWLVYTGHIGWGAFFTGFPLVSLISVFVIGKQQQHRQLTAHQQQASSQQRELPFPE